MLRASLLLDFVPLVRVSPSPGRHGAQELLLTKCIESSRLCHLHAFAPEWAHFEEGY